MIDRGQNCPRLRNTAHEGKMYGISEIQNTVILHSPIILDELEICVML